MIGHTDGLMQTYVAASLLFEGHYLLPFLHHSEAHLAQLHSGLVRVVIQLAQTGDAIAGHEGDEVDAGGIVVVAFVVGAIGGGAVGHGGVFLGGNDGLDTRSGESGG